MKIEHCQYAQVPQGGLLMGDLAKHCMRVTRHRLVHLLCVTMRERSLKHWVYSYASTQIFIASLLMLCYVFKAIAPLNLVLQTGNKQLYLTDVKTYIHLTRPKLESLRAGETKGFKEEKISMIWSTKQTANVKSPSKCKNSIC